MTSLDEAQDIAGPHDGSPRRSPSPAQTGRRSTSASADIQSVSEDPQIQEINVEASDTELTPHRLNLQPTVVLRDISPRKKKPSDGH